MKFYEIFKEQKESVLTGVLIGVVGTILATLILHALGAFSGLLLDKTFQLNVARNLANNEAFMRRVASQPEAKGEKGNQGEKGDSGDIGPKGPKPALVISDDFGSNRGDKKGTSETKLKPVDGWVCFLTEAGFEDLDMQGEWARCSIIKKDGYWYLQSVLGGGGGPDSNANCKARCISW